MSKTGPVPVPAVDRFVERVRLQPNGCWTIGAYAETNYSWIMLEDGTQQLGHRFAYEFLIGPIPEGLQLDHLCRRPHCVNPDHLEPVTPRENYLRGISPAAVNATKMECRRGHPFDEQNTYVYRGRRHCKACQRERVRDFRARRQAA